MLMETAERAYPDIERLWKSSSALDHARKVSVAIARRLLTERKEAARAETKSQVMMDAHLGYEHLRFFREQFPQIVPRLPANPRVIEFGAGLGWHAALLSAFSGARVLATEYGWRNHTPYVLGNVFTFERLSREEPRILKEVEILRSPDGLPNGLRFSNRVAFARCAAEATPVASNSMDFAFSNNCVEHFGNVDRVFEETWRVLKLGALHFFSTEPLFFSAFGHHFADIFPAPWGHLLWQPEDFARIAMHEAGNEREWEPGVPLATVHFVNALRNELNFVTPAKLRQAIRRSPWKVEGWVDLIDDRHAAFAREMDLGRTLQKVAREAIHLIGIRALLRKRSRAPLLQAPLLLSHRIRRLKHFAGR